MLENTKFGETLSKIQESGCSWFFITSSVMSVMNTRKNRKNLYENALKDEEFSRELQKQKNQYEDVKEAEDKAFKLWLKQKQREWKREETLKKIENDYSREDLKMLFDDWPLSLSIAAIIDKIKYSETKFPMNIIIATHSVGNAKDPLAKAYHSIVEQVQGLLKDLGLFDIDAKKTKVNIYRFKENNAVTGGAALANIYSMTNIFTSIVLQPKFKDEKHLIISIAFWNQDSSFPFQKNVMTIDYDKTIMDVKYSIQKSQEIIYAYATISIVMHDIHSLIEYGTSPLFPKFAIEHSIANQYPQYMEFACKEYSSVMKMNNGYELLEKYGTNTVKPNDCFDNSSLKQIHIKLTEALQLLKNSEL